MNTARGGTSPIIRSFLEFKRGENRSSRTLRAYRSILVRLEGTVGDLLTAGHGDISDWLDGLDLGSAGTRATYLTAVRSFYKWAQMMDLVGANPTDRVPTPKVRRGQPRPIGRDEFQRVVEQAPNDELRLWLLLAGTAGLRRLEITMLHAEDIMWGEGKLYLHRGTKGGSTRLVPIHPKLAAHLRAWPVTSGRMWERHPSTVGDRVAAHLRACGVDASCHQLRHYFGTEALRACRDITVVQRLMGHVSPATTMIYAAVLDDGGDAVASIAA